MRFTNLNQEILGSSRMKGKDNSKSNQWIIALLKSFPSRLSRANQ